MFRYIKQGRKWIYLQHCILLWNCFLQHPNTGVQSHTLSSINRWVRRSKYPAVVRRWPSMDTQILRASIGSVLESCPMCIAQRWAREHGESLCSWCLSETPSYSFLLDLRLELEMSERAQLVPGSSLWLSETPGYYFLLYLGLEMSKRAQWVPCS